MISGWALGGLLAATEVPAAGDYRVYIFGAYSAAVLLLVLFLAILYRRMGRLSGEIEELRGRPGSERDRTGG